MIVFCFDALLWFLTPSYPSDLLSNQFIKHCSDSSSSTSGSVTSCSASSVHDSTSGKHPSYHSTRTRIYPVDLLFDSSLFRSGLSAHQSHACSDTPVCQEPTPTTSSSSSSLPECALLDSLFSGSLTQFTVCERFHVSSVPEAFLDLSLATRHSDTTTTKVSPCLLLPYYLHSLTISTPTDHRPHLLRDPPTALSISPRTRTPVKIKISLLSVCHAFRPLGSGPSRGLFSCHTSHWNA